MPRNAIRRLVAGAALAGVVIPPALGEGKLMIIAQQPATVPIQVAPDQVVGFSSVLVTDQDTLGVLYLMKPPEKADFNVVSPAGVSFPFGLMIQIPNFKVTGFSNSTKDGIKTEYKAEKRTDGATGKDLGVFVKVTVTSKVQVPVKDKDGKVLEWVWQDKVHVDQQVFHGPPGSVIVPDPPQPPGLVFFCPDAVPASAEDEAIVLAESGIADGPMPQVWYIPSGELWFTHPGASQPDVVRYTLPDLSGLAAVEEGEATDDGGAESGDDQTVDDSADASEPTGGESSETGDLADNAVDNDDAEIVFGSADRGDAGDAAAAEGPEEAILPCGWGILTLLPLTALGLLGARGRAAYRRRAAGRQAR